jgi:hypothetical protein
LALKAFEFGESFPKLVILALAGFQKRHKIAEGQYGLNRLIFHVRNGLKSNFFMENI